MGDASSGECGGCITPEGGEEASILGAGGQGTTTSSSARLRRKESTEKQTFPADVPEAVKAAIKAWKLPKGHRRCPLPRSDERSIIYNWGVRYERESEADQGSYGVLSPRKRPQWWACLANEECRAKGAVRKIDSSSTSGATQHLLQHKKKSPRTQLMETTRKKADDKKQASLPSTVSQDKPVRFLELEYVKALVIHASTPFNLLEDEKVRRFFGIMNRSFGVEGLRSKAVKKLLVELYVATTRVFTAAMLKAVRAAQIPIVYINVDLWRSNNSREKYVGVRVRYLDDNMRVKSHLLAVKLFQPAPSLGTATDEVLMKWVRQVLTQFGLRDDDIAGAVTDAGVDVRGGVAAAFKWEWCVPHQMNRVTTDGLGMAPTRQQSKNLPCRDLVENMKRVVKRFNKSTTQKIELEDCVAETSAGKALKAKLPQTLHKRWVSLANMMERFLIRWDAIETFYRDSLKTAFPLAERKDEVEEVFSMVRAVKTCIEVCQTTTEATAQDAVQHLVLLMTRTFDPDRPLEVHHVLGVGEEKSASRPPETRQPQALSSTAVATRAAFHAALAKRVVQPRYGPGLLKHSHLFDLSMLLSPRGRNLKYLDTLKAAQIGKTGKFTVSPPELKDRIRCQLTSLVARSVETERSLGESKATVGGGSRAKRLRISEHAESASDKRMQAMRDAGIVDDSDDEGDEDSSAMATRSLLEEAESIVAQWLGKKIPKDFQREMTGSNTCDFWRKHGESISPHLKRVAQSVLGAPASSSVLYRDFCIPGQVIPRKRGSLDPASLEMLLYLRASHDLIPKDVPKLKDGEAEKAIPKRLRDAALLGEIEMLDPLSLRDEDEPDAQEEVILWEESDSDGLEVRDVLLDQERALGEEDSKGKRKLVSPVVAVQGIAEHAVAERRVS